MKSDLLTTVEAAALVEMSTETLRRHLTPRAKDGGKWQPEKRCYFDRGEVETLRQKEQVRRDADPEWIGVQEAMAILGLCYNGVRHRAELGLLERRMSRRGNRDRVLFRRDECEQMKQDGPRFARRDARSDIVMPRGWTDIDLAQLAMLIDCEGCIAIHRGRRPKDPSRANQLYTLRIVVVNTYRPVIDWLKDTFGGSIRAEETEPSRPNWRPRYRWTVCSRGAMTILQLTQPYYRIKHEEVAVAIEFQEHLISSRERRSARQKISPEEIAWRQERMDRLKALKHRILA
jgi:hypothetical protein